MHLYKINKVNKARLKAPKNFNQQIHHVLTDNK